MFWDKEIETILKKDLENLQFKRLKNTLEIAVQSRFYKELYREKGINIDRIKSLSDVQYLPFTFKNDLRNSFPDGFLAQPFSKYVRLHSSSGTTGRAIAMYYTRNDLNNWTDLMARGIFAVGLRERDVFQNIMGYGLFTGGLGLHYGAERVGALVIPAGTGGSKRQISLMQDFRTTAFHILPSYALKLQMVFEELGIKPDSLSLKMAIVGAEPHTEEIRHKIENIYGIKVFNCYGLTEMNGPGVAMECSFQDGIHLWEDHYYMEIIDPDTGEPLSEGEEGELVLTTLARDGMPIIRYRTGDITSIIPDICRCGRTHRRIQRIKARSDDMLIIKGVNIYPMQIEAVIMRYREIGNNYIIEINKKNFLDNLVIKAEIDPSMDINNVEALEILKKNILKDLKNEIIITPEVKLLAPGSIEHSYGKAVRVVDNRDNK